MSAPIDQLFLATEINEWAICATLIERDPARWSDLEAALIAAAADDVDGIAPTTAPAPVVEETAAFARFARLASAEAMPGLRRLLDAATTRALPYVLDEAELTLGVGAGGQSYPLTALPGVDDVPWHELSDVPTAMVTGSNGKTTTVRLLAACARTHGWHTDGVFLDDLALATGDYSGPAGARLVMRDRRTRAAILETARGGLLRRGLAASRVHTAVVTNVSPDHFGEYGIDDLAGLADVKLSVAAVVAPDGLLVLNADDALLRERANRLTDRFGRSPPLGWFALDADQTYLRDYGSRGAPTCGVRNGRLWLERGGEAHDLGLIAAMPLSIGGVALYNVANLAGAALGAIALGIPAAAIAATFARFGADPGDNVGRMMRFEVNGAHVLVDYAHNPDGLRGFLTVANRLRESRGRLGMLLGHAGNRQDAEIEEVARVAAEFHPDLIVVKENETQLRGRAPGAVPHIIRAELLRHGLPESALAMCDTELGAARHALAWARPGDVLALPIHSSGSRTALVDLLRP
jgi:UDP-N-acetylmuramyl tripeptide synthase